MLIEICGLSFASLSLSFGKLGVCCVLGDATFGGISGGDIAVGDIVVGDVAVGDMTEGVLTDLFNFEAFDFGETGLDLRLCSLFKSKPVFVSKIPNMKCWNVVKSITARTS